MSAPNFLSNLDPYLFTSFNRADAARAANELNEDVTGHGSVTLLPFTIRVYSPNWKSDKIPDFTESSRLGTVITGRGSRASLEELVKDPAVHSVEASRPVGPLARECATSVPFVKASTVHVAPLAERGDEVILAVIDEGIDVLHEAFRDASGKTRILYVWDQTDTSGTAPSPALGYGTLYTSADINSFIGGKAFPAGSKLATYRAGGDDGAHGTHVTSIAAGRQTGIGAADFFGGVAPQAKIVVVVQNMEVSAAKPESVGYSNSHLDALRFIDDVATAANLPVVVNVSQGMNAGAHDGTSALEVGFDEFANGGLKPGRAVVKSAGNERGFKGHAKLMMPALTGDEFVWQSKNLRRPEDMIEVWFQACNEFEFRLTNPRGTSSPWVTRANVAVTHIFAATGNKAELVFQRYCDDNGDSRLSVRVFPGSALSGIEAGTWKLEVVSKGVVGDGRIDAWVERMRSRAIEFVGSSVDDEQTLSIPGTARTVITAAAVRSSAPYQVASFSSFGPSRDGRSKPTLAAPGVGIRAAKNGTATGADAMSGTSMAAPHVAGAIALLFSRREKSRKLDPNLRQWNAAQIEKAIAQMTQNFNGRWTPNMGYGVLDIELFLTTFE